MKSKKKLGLGSAVSICVGLIVASSCLLSLGKGVGLAGSGFVFSLFIVVALNSMLALSFGELHGLMPNAEGGLGQYTLVGLGPAASIISNLSAYFIVNILACSVEIAVCGIVLNETFLPMVPAPLISLILMAALAIVNYMGVDIFSKIQNVVVVLLIGSFIAMGIISFFKLGTGTVITASQQTQPVVTGISGLVSLSALAFWLFIGIEFIIPVANDLKNPKRDVTLAMILGIVMLFLVQSVLGVGMTNYVTLDELANSTMPHMVFAENLLGEFGVYWMAIVTILAGISTANTVFASVSRILCGMAETEMMPKIFAKKNKSNTPVVGLLFIVISDAIIVITGIASSSGLLNLLLAAACFWLTSYILVSISVLVLRKRYPGREGRNEKLTFFGIPQIACIIGNLFMIWNIAEGDDRIFIYKLFFGLFMLVLLYTVVWIKGIKKMSFFRCPDIDDINIKIQEEDLSVGEIEVC